LPASKTDKKQANIDPKKSAKNE